MNQNQTAGSVTGVRELELQFKGACAMAARRRSATVRIEVTDADDMYETLLQAVRGYVPEAIPCLLMRDGLNLEQQPGAGALLEDGDVLTVLPVILGG